MQITHPTPNMRKWILFRTLRNPYRLSIVGGFEIVLDFIWVLNAVVDKVAFDLSHVLLRTQGTMVYEDFPNGVSFRRCGWRYAVERGFYGIPIVSLKLFYLFSCLRSIFQFSPESSESFKFLGIEYGSRNLSYNTFIE